jgi:hypothetical protein
MTEEKLVVTAVALLFAVVWGLLASWALGSPGGSGPRG